MTLIERYIYAVSSNLPEDIREDVELELESNIMDMLSKNPHERDIEGVLESLGNPAKLALEYYPNKRYLIGPAVYDKYVSTLKMVLTIVVIAFTVIIGLKWVFTFGNNLEGNLITVFIGLFTEIIYSVLEGMLQAFFWVTLIFVIIDRNKVIKENTSSAKEKWSVDKLPKNKISGKNRISRSKTITSVCFTIFFAFLICLQPKALAVIVKDGSGFNSLPLWNMGRLDRYIPIIITLVILSLGISIWKLYTEHWTESLAVANIVFNLLICVLVIVMFKDNQLWSQKVQSHFQDMMAKSGMTHLQGVIRFTFLVPMIFIIISIWDSIDGFIRSRK